MSSPKHVTPTDPAVPIAAGQAANQVAQTGTMAQNTIGQNTPYGDLNYTTSIDPITGKPKYQANQSYTPTQQAIFDFMQANQMGIGGTAFDAINNTFPQYGGDPNLVGQAGSLTNQALDQQLPAWEQFDAPARAQRRTELINQGLVEGSVPYDLEMKKLETTQNTNRGQWLAGFQPQAFQEAQQQYQLPLSNVATMLGLSRPGALPQQIINTPTANLQPADVTGAYNITAQQQQFNAQQDNAYWNAVLGGGAKLGSAALMA